jgi:hypothetical protein
MSYRSRLFDRKKAQHPGPAPAGHLILDPSRVAFAHRLTRLTQQPGKAMPKKPTIDHEYHAGEDKLKMRMPSQKPSSLMICPCGQVFDSHLLEHTLIHVPHIVATFDDGTRH